MELMFARKNSPPHIKRRADVDLFQSFRTHRERRRQNARILSHVKSQKIYSRDDSRSKWKVGFCVRFASGAVNQSKRADPPEMGFDSERAL